MLNPGQSRESENLVTVRTCGFHDHNDPDNVELARKHRHPLTSGAGTMHNYISGQWTRSAATETVPVLNPATG